MTMNKKTRIMLMCLSLALLLGALLTFTERRGITELTDYFKNMHQEQQSGQQDDVTEPEGNTSPAEQGGADTPAPRQDNPKEGGDLPGDSLPATTEKGQPATSDMGTLTTESTQEVENPGPDGVVRHTKITISEQNLEWTKPEKYPHPGDLLRIVVPVNREYVFQVLAFEQMPDNQGLVVHADLCDVKGQVLMMFYQDHFSLQLTDFENKRAYSIYYNVKDNYYTVDERDMTLIHTTPTPVLPENFQHQ